MKFNINNKGFSFSPYLMIFMMFLGIVMAFHFIVVDSEKAVAIAEEGSIVKNALQLEGEKSGERNLMLLSAYDYIDRGLNRPDLQLPKCTVGEENPITHELCTLEKYLKYYIQYDLNNQYPGYGSWGPVTIDYKDDKGNIRTDGFLVSAESGSTKVEKFVDSGVFGFYDRINSYESKFFDSLTSSMECKFGGITCQKTQSRDWLSTHSDAYVYSIACSKYREYIGDGNYEDLDETLIPDEQFKSAGEIVKKIEEALKDVAEQQLNGYDRFNAYRANNVVVFYNVDYIEAAVEMDAWPVGGHCCYYVCEADRNYCKDDKYEEDYKVNVNVKGKVHFKELKLIGDATMKETSDGTEVCIKSPFMNKKGEIIFLEKSKKDFDLPYSISLTYVEGCPPKEYSDNKVKESLDTNSMRYYINEESLKFTSKPVICEWGPKDPKYKPVCAGMKKNLDLCYCKGGCSVDEKCPSDDPTTWSTCPGHPEKETCFGYRCGNSN